MNSALKPVLASAGVPQPGGQSSPAKGNVAGVNHASVGHPQGAQNSLNHNANNVQNLTQNAPAPQAPPHAVPSMAPVSANMAQMAQNMSNHGNLSHLNQNSAPPAPTVTVSPAKAPSTSSPLSLVAEKPNPSQPLALTRSPEKEKADKKEPDSTAQSNGTIDSPKAASHAPVTLKPQNTEATNKQDIAKTSPSTTKPPEKPTTPSAPKPESANTSTPTDVPTQLKMATPNEPTEKPSPSKLVEPKPTPTADVAPTQIDTKPVPETAKDSPSTSQPEKPATPAKQDPPTETAKTEPVKVEETKKVEEKKEPEKAPSLEEKVEVKEKEIPKKEDQTDKPQKVEKVEPKKVEPKKDVKPKSTLKLATVTPPLRKRKPASPAKGDGPSSAKKVAEESTPDARTKRNRTKVQLYQSPTPELAMATKLSASAGRSTPTKPNDDKLIVFYKNEYLAVRNAEGGFYVCQTMQNVYRATRKIKIRWLSQDKTTDPSGETYKPDFYDVTDMECVLTTLSLSRAAGGGGSQILRAAEQARATSILQRALRAENSPCTLQLTPEHPDGLDLSLYKDESQLDKKSRKRGASKSSPRNKDSAIETVQEEATPVKKARITPKRSPKPSRKAKSPKQAKRTAGSTPHAASSKTATAVVEKAAATRRATPRGKSAPSPPAPRRGRRSTAKEAKPSPAPTPSTSTGKTARRKLPARK